MVVGGKERGPEASRGLSSLRAPHFARPRVLAFDGLRPGSEAEPSEQTVQQGGDSLNRTTVVQQAGD